MAVSSNLPAAAPLLLFLLIGTCVSPLVAPVEAFLQQQQQQQQQHYSAVGARRLDGGGISSSRSPFFHLTSTATPTAQDTTGTDTAEQPEGEKFNFFKCWYPLVPVEILDPEEPHRFQLLGTDIVVWNDARIEGDAGEKFGPKPKRGKFVRDMDSGKWRAFADECPHRKVPLSEGRVENDGTLLCSYHAWRFDGEGNVVDVPQVMSSSSSSEGDNDSGGSKKNAELASLGKRANCNSFPTQVVDGILWVWAESGDDAQIESKLTPPNKYEVPDDLPKDRLQLGVFNFRELPYGADYFIENVVDPAHVAVR